MKFQFHVNLNDKHYLDYNIFWIMRSHYGKKMMVGFRVIIAIIFCVSMFKVLYDGGFSPVSFISIVPMVVVLGVLELLISPLFVLYFKVYFKSLKKKGKMGYSPSSVVEFYEDKIVETTPDNRSEYKYSGVERISLVDNKAIYIHLNNIMAYILPLSCFENVEQYNTFLEFITTKCVNFDKYN